MDVDRFAAAKLWLISSPPTGSAAVGGPDAPRDLL